MIRNFLDFAFLVLRKSRPCSIVKCVCALLVFVTCTLLVRDQLYTGSGDNFNFRSVVSSSTFRSFDDALSRPATGLETTSTILPVADGGLYGVDAGAECGGRWLRHPPSARLHNCTTSSCSKLTCENFLINLKNRPKIKSSIHKQLSQFNKKYKHTMTSDIAISRMKCTTFLRRYGYDRNVTTQEELEFPLAFNILVHKDAAQVNRLLSLLYRPHNTYCIHVDNKSPAHMRNAVAKIVSCLDNVFQPKVRETIVYAGYSRLQADINCMREHDTSKVKWKYLLNTAGQALPLHTNLDMVRILKTLKGHNDIEAMLSKKIVYRYMAQWSENTKENTLKRTGKQNPRPPHGLTIVPGNAYASFTRAFVHWVLVDKVAVGFLKWCRNTYSPDEHYWATLQHSYVNPKVRAPGSYSGYPNETFISVTANWYPSHKCYGSWSSHKICIYNAEDINAMLYKKALFANKFDLNMFPIGFECLENWIRYKEECPHAININSYTTY